MYEFATVALLGLALAVLVELIGSTLSAARATRTTLALVLGLAVAWVMDYSILTGWGVEVREAWIGIAATGLIIGSLAVTWPMLLDAIGGRRAERDENAEDHRVPRAA